MQGDAQSGKPLRVVILREVAHTTKGMAPTGSLIRMLEDSPLFVSWGEVGKRAIQEGEIALEQKMFRELVNIISSCRDEIGHA